MAKGEKGEKGENETKPFFCGFEKMPLPIPEIERRTVIGTDGMLTIQYPFD
jgi:hypothetical protein